MSKRRIDDLFEYLDLLYRLNDDDYHCHKEIAEVISEIRVELDIV